MRRFGDMVIAAVALLAGRGLPWACEPNEVSAGLSHRGWGEVRSVAEQPISDDASPNPTEAGQQLREVADRDSSRLLRPRYETCGEIGDWLPSEVRDDIDNRVVRFDGAWRYEDRDSGHFGNSAHFAREPGATATFEVPADSEYGWLAIGYMRGPMCGLVSVHFDETIVETIDLYSPTAQYQCERGYYLGEHLMAAHRLKLRVEGTSGRGKGSDVLLDYFAAGW